jgi:hypothetical protein
MDQTPIEINARSDNKNAAFYGIRSVITVFPKSLPLIHPEPKKI